MPTNYSGTAAGLNGQVITAFNMGDNITITDETPTVANVTISGDKLVYNGGSITIDNLGPGRYIVRAAGTSGTDIQLQQDAHNDFNGDGYSDMLLRDSTGNWLTEWTGGPNGVLTNNGANSTLYFDPSWHVAGTGDFNGDGRVDFLLQNNTSGWVTDWLGNSNGSFTNNGANTSLYFTSNWQIVATGDFNGDGKTDFLLHDTTNGWLTEWTGNASGGFTNNGANSTEYLSSDWKVVGTGDINGDGTEDILLQNSAGWVTDWLGTSTGAFTNNGSNCSLFFGADWHVVATGDFNGDGKTDMLIENSAGWYTDWLGTSTGGFTNNGANCSFQLGSGWTVAGVGDLNGDGIDDLLLRNNSTGWTTDWLGTASGGFVNNGSHFSTQIATNWHVQDPFL